MEKYEIWCKSTYGTDTKMIYCKSIWKRWDEEEIPFKRRAKRTFKRYQEIHAAEHRTFYLLEE